MGKIDIVSGIFQHNLVEIFNDDTNDTGDYWQICMDGAGNGGAAPDANDWRIEIIGHTTLTVYKGTGTGWTPVATPAGIAWANSIDISPLLGTPHWILEFRLDKSAGPITNQPPHGLRVAVYDASNAAAGVQSARQSSSLGKYHGICRRSIPGGLNHRGHGAAVFCRISSRHPLLPQETKNLNALHPPFFFSATKLRIQGESNKAHPPIEEAVKPSLRFKPKLGLRCVASVAHYSGSLLRLCIYSREPGFQLLLADTTQSR
jgi:hypothetical protein